MTNLSDFLKVKKVRFIAKDNYLHYHFIDVHGIRHGFAVPLNDETGEPLTEAVLDE